MTDENFSETVWSRIEPIARDGEMTEGLRAPVADPLWLLTRQWQLGEFDGEDAGSPVDVHVDATFDHLSRVQHRGGGDGTEPIPYDGGPLEATVERETVLDSAERPDSRLAANAGQQFVRLLSREAGTPDDLATEDFPDGYQLQHADGDDAEPVSHGGQRFADVLDGRALDGHLVYRAVDAAIEDGQWSASVLPWADDGPTQLPVPDGLSASDSAFTTAASAFHEWYGELYDEPTEESGAAWDPERLEYDVRVSTGAPGTNDGDTETVLAAEEYEGGRLDWFSFSPAGSDADDGTTDTDAGTLFANGAPANPDELRTARSRHALPTKPSFKGMPTRRFWEFEDGDVKLDALSTDDASSRALLHYALVFGNDWYRFPLQTPLGSLARIEDLTVTDSFGIEQSVPALDDEAWNMYSVRDLPGHDEPGLFLPPVLDDVVESDPVERVSLGRDEMANLAFAIEQRIEDPTGQSVERDEYVRPTLAVESVESADDPDDEEIVFRNPGRRALDVGGWIVTDGTDTYEFPSGTTVEPADVLTLSTGSTQPGEHSEATLYWDLDDPVWSSAESVTVVSVYEPCDCENDDHEMTTATVTSSQPPLAHLRLRRRVPLRPGRAVPDASYALATDLFDHWFALRPSAEEYEADLADSDRYQIRYRHFLELALVLDAEALDATTKAELPRPAGRILRSSPDDTDEQLRIYDEEILTGGKELTRSYQLSTWTDGTSQLWSGRRVTPDRDEVGSSTLQFDVLENWAADGGE
jgi:hypothetical protein